jgi:hypothetical protein
MSQNTKESLHRGPSPEEKKIVQAMIDAMKSGKLKWYGKDGKTTQVDSYKITYVFEKGIYLNFEHEKTSEEFKIRMKAPSTPVAGLSNTPLIESFKSAWEETIKEQKQEMIVDIQKLIDSL